MPTAPFLAPERDEAFHPGRAKASSGNWYTIPGAGGVSAAAVSGTLNTDFYGPIYVAAPIVVDQVACEVTSGAAGNLRMGLYAADKDWQPRRGPLLDSGAIAISVAVKTYTPASPVYLPRGRYLTAINLDTTSNLRAFRSARPGSSLTTGLGTGPYCINMSVGRAHAAFPTPGTLWDTSNGGSDAFNYLVVLRVLAL